MKIRREPHEGRAITLANFPKSTYTTCPLLVAGGHNRAECINGAALGLSRSHTLSCPSAIMHGLVARAVRVAYPAFFTAATTSSTGGRFSSFLATC